MNITIKNFRGIKEIDFQIKKITIIGGDNGAGKTSIAQAIASAVTNQ